MPSVVVVGGIIQCKHKGTITLSSGDNRLEISGAAALTAGMEAGLSFAPARRGSSYPVRSLSRRRGPRGPRPARPQSRRLRGFPRN